MHKLLGRQLRRKTGIDGADGIANALQELGAVAPQDGFSPDAVKLLAALPSLIADIETSYQQFDRDIELRRRSLEISSEELIAANDRLRADAASRQRAYEALLDAANRLLADAKLPGIESGETNIETLAERMSVLVRARAVAQRDLARSEERLRIAQGVAKMIVMDLDLLTDTLIFSDSPEWLRGPKPESGGKYPFFKDQVHPDDRARFLANRQRAIETFEPASVEFRIVRTDGAMLWIQAHLRAFADAEGKAVRLIVALRDISERKKAEDALRNSEERFRSLTALSSDWYWEQDEQFRFTQTHGETDARGGIQAAEHTRRTRWELPHTAPVSCTWDEHKADLEKHQPFRDLLLKRDVPGNLPRYVSVSGAPIFSADGKFSGYRGIARDVTDSVMIEESLRWAKVAAEDASRAKSEFLANMSHEIRTPMNGVLGMAELLLSTPLNSKQKHFAETVRRSGEALLHVINDILDFSKIEARRLDLEYVDFDLRETLEDVVQLLAEGAAAKDLELLCRIARDVPAMVNGDPTRIRQIVTNLVGNALKFTDAGEVAVSIFPLERGADSCVLRFEVRDTGIGIPLDAKARVFQPFSQADGSTTRHYGGTGLGLSISKELTELMGGQIGLESVVGQGTMFWFTARMGVVQAEGLPNGLPNHTHQLAQPLAGRRVLVVDDNATHREVLREQIAEVFGMECVVAASGQQALDVVREAAARGRPFDVAVIDGVMPGMDGLALGAALRADAALAHTARVLLTSMKHAHAVEQAREAGFITTLTKPIRQSELLRALRVALNLHEDMNSRTLEIRAASSRTARFSGRVLVAEDNAVNQEVARAVLMAYGCDVHLAGDGREALQAIQRERFDLVLMDCQMPEMDGYAATRAIRALEAQGMIQRVPIVALTAHATEADRQRCLEAGMDSFLTKPFMQAALRKEIARWLPDSLGAAAPSAELAAPSAQAEDEGGLNQQALDELRSLDPDGAAGILNQIIQAYLDDTPNQLAQIRASIIAENVAEMTRAAHSLISSSFSVGAMRVGERARDIEAIGRANTIAGCHALLADTELQFTKAKKLLAACMTAKAA